MKQPKASIPTLLAYSLVVLGIALTVWLGSGSIAPYASSHIMPRVAECGYLQNWDHPHFFATFQMLNGEPSSTWEGSVVLRRVLYPLLAFLPMKHFGFMLGGLLASVIINALGTVWFIKHICHTFSSRAAVVTALLLVMYPGITYWGGLPYCYAVIPALVMGCYISLSRLAARPNYQSAVIWGAVIGICCTGYDLLPIYVPAVILVLARLKRFALMIPALGVMILPTMTVSLYLKYFRGVSLANSNSSIYSSIASAFLHPSTEQFQAWLGLVSQAPRIFVHNFFFSNFFVLPTAFVVVYGVGRYFLAERLSLVEWAVTVATLLVWCLNNFAPPYSGWQMRGMWIARIYQPIFIVFVVYMARVFSRSQAVPVAHRCIATAIAACVVAHWVVVVGPLVGIVGPTDRVYYEFYRHSVPGAFAGNMAKYGVRPLGMCREGVS